MRPEVERSLTPTQARVALEVLAEEENSRRHLLVSLSGAHAYGFPSPDSDLDLKAVHVDPTERLLGFPTKTTTAERLEVVDGVEVDY
ncbi:MAG TPA: nucleotidyltransferase domain-containing protein, partial [Myxococcaceae bacterium]|nr:nucleotidyltransferase domain-containing protein [Myxococcaceae bacterium]